MTNKEQPSQNSDQTLTSLEPVSAPSGWKAKAQKLIRRLRQPRSLKQGKKLESSALAKEEPSFSPSPTQQTIIAPPIMGSRSPQANYGGFRRLFQKMLDPLTIAEWFTQVFHRQGSKFYGKLLTILLCTFFLADLTALLLERYIPEPSPIRLSRNVIPQQRAKSLQDYQAIFARNLFNSQGSIPGEEATSTSQDLGGAPVKTSLPLNLVGILALRDELKSIATIEDKAASQIYPVRIQDEIPGKARILSIEPYRVIFVNTSSGKREFIELPVDLQVSNPRVTIGSKGGGATGPGIERVSPTQFNVSRIEVDKALSDFNQVLTQARAVPNFENGLPAGYKLFQIVPGSIYDKLGLLNGDTLCGLNGQSINDPAKAFELLGELKTASHLELCVKRDGKQQNYAYDIR